MGDHKEIQKRTRSYKNVNINGEQYNVDKPCKKKKMTALTSITNAKEIRDKLLIILLRSDCVLM